MYCKTCDVVTLDEPSCTIEASNITASVWWGKYEDRVSRLSSLPSSAANAASAPSSSAISTGALARLAFLDGCQGGEGTRDKGSLLRRER
jgi:hypothetical protein